MRVFIGKIGQRCNGQASSASQQGLEGGRIKGGRLDIIVRPQRTLPWVCFQSVIQSGMRWIPATPGMAHTVTGILSQLSKSLVRNLQLNSALSSLKVL